MKKLKIIEVVVSTENLDVNSINRILAKKSSLAERLRITDREFGILTRKQQKSFFKFRIGVAGTGGMGGPFIEALVRTILAELGFGDPDNVEKKNIGRQTVAQISTVGQNKSLVMAKMARDIHPYTTLRVYPMGINKESARHFVANVHLVIDEIEVFELEAPAHLHQAAREAGIPILGCNTAGYGTHLFYFTPSSMHIEDAFGVTLKEARKIDIARRNGTLSYKQRERLVDRLLLVVAPELENFHPVEFPRIRKRLIVEGAASILPTGPLFAAGFLGHRAVLHLLGPDALKKAGKSIPPMPGYAYMDARHVEGKIVTEQWFPNIKLKI